MRYTRFVMMSYVAFAAGCGGGGGDGGGTPVGPAATLASITATPSPLNLSAGARQTITVVGMDTQGRVISGLSAQFATDNSTVAEVLSGGEVIGLSAGSASITVSASSGGVSKSASVPVTVTGSLPSTASVAAGSSSNTFTPQVVAVARNGSVTWTFGALVHNVTFASVGAPSNIGDINNTSISKTFTQPGNFSYQCTIHAGMNGSVFVR